jgi:hypothetical protein
MDDIVIAWKPLPEPWIPAEEINKKEISSDEASLKAVYNNLEIAMCILNAMIGENARGQAEINDMDERHTIRVDERTEYNAIYCSVCGGRCNDNFLNFCPGCFTDMREEENGD